MNAALYWTVWIALALFAAGEAGKRGLHDGRVPARWAWWAFATGAFIASVHVAIAMGVRHGWRHDSAVLATARQTAEVYGVNWGGGVYVNYAFLALWLFEAWRWRRSPTRYAHRTRSATWLVRAFYLVVIANAAVVFAGGLRRVAGGLILAWLVASWWPSSGRRSTGPATARCSS